MCMTDHQSLLDAHCASMAEMSVSIDSCQNAKLVEKIEDAAPPEIVVEQIHIVQGSSSISNDAEDRQSRRSSISKSSISTTGLTKVGNKIKRSLPSLPFIISSRSKENKENTVVKEPANTNLPTLSEDERWFSESSSDSEVEF